MGGGWRELAESEDPGTSRRGNDGKLGTCSHYYYLMAEGGKPVSN